MKIQLPVLELIDHQVGEIIQKANELEIKYLAEISAVQPRHKKSAKNLVHYLAFRSFDIDILQGKLRGIGLPSLTHIEGHVMESLLSVKTIINHLQGKQVVEHKRGVVTSKLSKKLLDKNTKLLFGFKSKKRRTRIMVTLPSTASEDPKFIKRMLRAGMNSARINCAHDTPEVWKKMIDRLEDAKLALKKNCKVMMDLGGPKLRTGSMKEGPKVMHIRPVRDDLGKVISPAHIWIAPPDILPPGEKADAILPINELLFSKIKRGDSILFTDSRGKKCEIVIEKKEGLGKWGLCNQSAYVTTGTEMELHRKKKSGKEVIYVGEILPLEQALLLKSGDVLILTRESTPGKNAVYNDVGKLIKPAIISCTLPEVFNYIKKGEPIFFDDGKIEGRIEEVNIDYVKVKITHAKDQGSKLKADKGINLPDSNLPISGLTEKDIKD
ncbi:MAG: hypothetical protein KAQ62_11380, partial [Cyclobacteriaceae bacterium]|nr:hypothetical protein [Cyclobacteriaceae bacterium]